MVLVVAVFAVLPAVTTWWMAPRVFILADRKVARRHLSSSLPHSRAASVRRTVSRPVSIRTESGSVRQSAAHERLISLSSMCDAIARALKSGRSAHQALADAIGGRAPVSPHWDEVRRLLLAGDSMSRSLDHVTRSPTVSPDDRLCAELLSAAVVGPTPVAAGVEHAAAVLRDVAASRADLAVATSQARLSALILTVLPLVVLAGGFLTNHAFRASVASMSVLVPMAVGIALNRAGWAWIKRLLDGVARAAARFELAEIVDRVCVSLMAGFTLAQACELLDGHGSSSNQSIGALISGRVREGLPLAECLEPLAASYALQGRLFADVLVGAERDGLPIVATVARIAQDVRIERRRRVDTAIRQIPVKLTIPLVVCVLPGFLLTTLVPLVASSVGALTVHLPGVISPFGT